MLNCSTLAENFSSEDVTLIVSGVLIVALMIFGDSTLFPLDFADNMTKNRRPVKRGQYVFALNEFIMVRLSSLRLGQDDEVILTDQKNKYNQINSEKQQAEQNEMDLISILAAADQYR